VWTIGGIRGAKRALGVVLILALWPTAGTQAGQPADERPSFLHVMTDDQTIDSLRHMPHTNRLLRRRGTRFSNYHVTQPLCCPSRTSFLTGQYPHNHGVLFNGGPNGGFSALDFDRTLYTAMHAAGYRTGWIGKAMNNKDGANLPPPPGFDEWFVPLYESQHNMFNYRVSDNGTERAIRGTHQNPLYAELGRRFIAEADKRPFLLTVSVFSPHWTPCTPGTSERCPPVPAPVDEGSFAGHRFPFGSSFRGDRSDRQRVNEWWRRELESLQSVDRLVRTLVAELRRAGRLDDTYVIFHSDNGLLHGQHGVFFEKNEPWDRSVRVPLLIRGPRFEEGGRRDDLTANVDVPATILDAAGVGPPRARDGYSLLRRKRRGGLLIEGFAGPRPFVQIKTAKGWAYWQRTRTGQRYLYRLDRDREQVANKARKRPRLANRLHRRMMAISDCAAPCP
jgi:N-acetylglucosamine-6-sulfatase